MHNKVFFQLEETLKLFTQRILSPSPGFVSDGAIFEFHPAFCALLPAFAKKVVLLQYGLRTALSESRSIPPHPHSVTDTYKLASQINHDFGMQNGYE